MPARRMNGMVLKKPTKKQVAVRKYFGVSKPYGTSYSRSSVKPRVTRKRVTRGYSGIGRIGSILGAGIGGYLGGPSGASLGSRLGGLGSYTNYIGKIFGHGDYTTAPKSVSSNTVINSTQVPGFGSTPNNVRIRHREYLCDIYSSGTTGAFQIQQFPIQPGNSVTFPWLSEVVGTNFQQYRINGMVFEFKSTSSDALNSTNTALGTVVMATDYDSKDAPFVTKAQMENTEFAVSCKPSQCMIHAIECKRSQTTISELYMNAAQSVPSGADIRLYNLGNFQIATVGMQATNVNLGELWISYDISLFKPIQLAPQSSEVMTLFALTGVTGTQPLALDTSLYPQPAFDTIGVTWVSNTVLTMPYTMPNNSYFVCMSFVRGASTASLASFPQPALTNGLRELLPLLNENSGGISAPQVGATGTTVFQATFFYYDGTGTLANPPTLTFAASAVFPGTPLQGGNLLIIGINGNLPAYKD